MFDRNQLDQKTEIVAPDRPLRGASRPPGSREPKQRRMMVIALTLLLVTLGLVLYRDREFWFPDSQETASDEQTDESATRAAAIKVGVAKATSPTKRRGSLVKSPAKDSAPTVPEDPPAGASITRTVLPPLEVEVVAGNVHQAIRPGNNSVRVDLQPGTPQQTVSVPPASSAANTSPGLTNAAEHVQMSADTSAIVSQTVRPGYPLLARQMKVQGSVILQAMISRDGDIQGLQVVSGPPILASAAQEAVKQWRFKPHYQGSEAVETQAKITVNFTISTN
jgi:TonB family protein